MTALPQQMISAMRQRGFAIRTHQSYLYAVQDLARYFHQPPDQLQPGTFEHEHNIQIEGKPTPARTKSI